MSFSFKTKTEQKIWQIIQSINESWVNGHPENLVKFFHEDITITNSDFHKQGVGRDVCVESYISFISQAIIKDFKVMNPDIHVYGNTAIAIYSFEITYEMNGKRFSDTGRDVFIFTYRKDKWLAVWRTVIQFD